MTAGPAMTSEPVVDPDDGIEPDSEASWQRLDIRVVWVDVAMFLISLIPGLLGWFVFDIDFFDTGSFGVWPIAVATLLGITGAVADLLRWMRTRYRITDDRVEQRIGWVFRKYRFVPRERIRSVDTTARLRHRVAGLRVVHIGSGEAQTSFKMDAVSTAMAEQIRRDLLRAQPGAQPTPVAPAGPTTPTGETAPAGETVPAPTAQETVIATFRWSWIFYNLFSIWAFLVAAVLMWGAFWLFQMINIDLRDVVNAVIDWKALGLAWSIVVGVSGVFVIGVIGLAASFVNENWNLQLVRTTTENGTALLSRQGLLNTREVYRDDRRLRGIHLSEPLLWRWIGLTETDVISTGLSNWSAGSEPASTILPRGPISEARRVAALVLQDGTLPLEAPLRRHARGALYRRLVFAVCIPAFAAALLAAFGYTNALPDWVWLIPVGLFPVAVLFAVLAYRSLGHNLVGDYLVLRSGLSRRQTTALQRPAVIGWTLHESLLNVYSG